MQFASPTSIVDQFALLPTMHIADIGTGSGAYALAVHEHLGANGRIYACDVQRSLVERLRSEAKEKNMLNLSCIWSDAEAKNGTKLAEQSLDGVIVANILFSIENKKAFLTEITRVLKPTGKVYFVEWADSEEPFGPKNDRLITPEKAITLFADFGFTKERELRAGTHHYGMVFIKNKD